MPEKIRTSVDRDVLRQYCDSIPECRTFLENFFLSCQPFRYEDNLANYQMDLRLYFDRPHIRKNRRKLEMAFSDIAGRADKGDFS